MDAVKFLKEKKRMCDSFDDYCTDCTGCKIESKMSGMHCAEYIEKHPEQAVAIVEKWAEEHPQETYLTQFLKNYPNAPLNEYGVPSTCIKDLGSCTDTCTYCVECWNRPIEEE